MVVSMVIVAAALWGQVSPASRPVVGVLHRDAAAQPGYTLIAPMRSTRADLVDLDGRVVHSWRSQHSNAHSCELLPDGRLLRCSMAEKNPAFHAGGAGGMIEVFDWDGKILWAYSISNDRYSQHHDVEPLPNGNFLMIVRERKSTQEAIDAGRNPKDIARGEVYPDCILEVKPDGLHGGTIVWEWKTWDHLVQDFDPQKKNFGVVADHPELVDVNYDAGFTQFSPDEKKRMREIGYLAGDDDGDDKAAPRRRFVPRIPRRGQPDWMHSNAVAYNAERDEIALSVLGFCEVWIIDHATTTVQAAGHRGGKRGRGGDLLYRWGNAEAYRRGTARERQLFAQHDTQWLRPLSGGGWHMTIFNNGRLRPAGERSSIEEIVLPIGGDGGYVMEPGKAFGPAAPVWSFGREGPKRFFSLLLSSAQRLPNGNTLICEGNSGRVFEITADGRKVWEYLAPDDAGQKAFRGENALFRAARYAPNDPAVARLAAPRPRISERQPLISEPRP